MSQCVACGRSIPKGEINCRACGELLAGTRQVAVEPLRQEATVAHGLLQSAGFHPVLAYLDDSGEPHPIDSEASFLQGAGLMVPVTTAFGVISIHNMPILDAMANIGQFHDNLSIA